MKPRHRRLALVAAGLTLASAGVTLALGAFRSNLVFFVTPTQIAAGQAERANRTGQHRIHDPFGDLTAIGQKDRRVSHQVTDIAHEQQAAPG